MYQSSQLIVFMPQTDHFHILFVVCQLRRRQAVLKLCDLVGRLAWLLSNLRTDQRGIWH
jgi:hypothetical protein